MPTEKKKYEKCPFCKLQIQGKLWQDLGRGGAEDPKVYVQAQRVWSGYKNFEEKVLEGMIYSKVLVIK